MTDSDNLFLALKKFTPGENLDPRENFLTEAFAWILRQHPELGGELLRFVVGLHEADFPLAPGAAIRWMTQEGDAQTRLDMVADLGDGRAVIFEHKVWSSLGDDQIERYRAYGNHRWSRGVVVVLITPTRGGHEQRPDVALTWSQVYHRVEGWLDEQTQEAPMVAQFLGLLRAEGLGPPAPVSHASILAYFPGQQLVPQLLDLLRAAEHRDWRWFYDKPAWTRRDQGPYLNLARGGTPKWGRLGLELLQPWEPGVFVGVMLNGTDHMTVTSQSHLGPDFCLILSFDSPGSPLYDEFIGSEEFGQLRERLARDAHDWDFLDPLKTRGSAANPWHPLFLRRPLLEVLQGTTTAPQQTDRFMSASEEAVDLLLAGGELERWRLQRESRSA